MRQFSTVLLNGYCGSGKTVMMIETICRLGTKTAILVNKQDLAHQWEDRIRTFAPKLRTKIVHGTQGDMDDCDIVIFLIQSLFSRSYASPLIRNAPVTDEQTAYPRKTRRLKPGEAYAWQSLATFGLVCVDEAHRIIASTALPCLAMFPSARIICATATPDRNDSTHDVLGPVFGVATAILQQPHVAIGVYSFCLEETSHLVPVWKRSRKRYGGQEQVDLCREPVSFEDINYSRMVCYLGDNVERNRHLLACIWDAAVVRYRQVLVLGLIKAHLVKLAAACYWMAKQKGMVDADRLFAGLLFPETAPDMLDRVKRANVVFATFQYASEAFDVGTLSALVLVSPYKSRLVQVFGRILRRKRQTASEAPSFVKEIIAYEYRADSGFVARHVMEGLPLVYLCMDAANPWFTATFRRQIQLLRKTYDSQIHSVEIKRLGDWPESIEECVSDFYRQGQVTELDKIFAEQEDLFGDMEDESVCGESRVDDENYDEESEYAWFE